MNISTVNTLTGLRGIAALWVVIFHIWVGMGEPNVTFRDVDITPFFMGEFGVDIFFVISGFVVFLPCAYAMRHDLSISWRNFYIRRAARIFPAYHASLLFILLLFAGGIYSTNISALDLLKHIFLFQNIPPQDSTQILGVYWTLPVEMNFYLCVPILFLIIKRLGIIPFLLFCIFTCIAYRYFIFGIYGNNEHLWVQINQLLGRLDEFAIGIIVSVLFTRMNTDSAAYRFIKKHDYLGIITGAIGIIICIYYFKLSGGKTIYYSGNLSLFIFDTALATSIGVLIMSLTLQGKVGNLLFSNPVILFLGTISYGIYIWHSLIFKLLIDNLPIMTKINFLQEATIGICVTIIVASTSYFLLEKPLIKLAKRKTSAGLFKN